MAWLYEVRNDALAEARACYPDGGNKVAAIRVIRTHTKCGLRSAKQFVESGYDFKRIYQDVNEDVKFIMEDRGAYLSGRLFDLNRQIAEIIKQMEEL